MEKIKRIVLQNISKKFKIGFKKRQGILAKIISLLSGREPKKEIVCLDNLLLTVNSGEIIGLIGANGSGKSTLLRVIAGIYKHDAGRVLTRGKIISLINLNIGLQERLSMRDNIYLCCSLFGLGRDTIKRNMASIAEFAELDDYIDTKLYQFSSGMLQRLAFSIAMHCNPEILLLDEVFEVGDEDFRKKSAEKIKEIVKNGASVILVSHELDMIKKHCDKVIWLDNGSVKKEGPVKEILKEYKKCRLENKI